MCKQVLYASESKIVILFSGVNQVRGNAYLMLLVCVCVCICEQIMDSTFSAGGKDDTAIEVFRDFTTRAYHLEWDSEEEDYHESPTQPTSRDRSWGAVSPPWLPLVFQVRACQPLAQAPPPPIHPLIEDAATYHPSLLQWNVKFWFCALFPLFSSAHGGTETIPWLLWLHCLLIRKCLYLHLLAMKCWFFFNRWDVGLVCACDVHCREITENEIMMAAKCSVQTPHDKGGDMSSRDAWSTHRESCTSRCLRFSNSHSQSANRVE